MPAHPQTPEEMLIEPVLEVMRSEWKTGATGRHLRQIVAGIDMLSTRAPASQTVSVITDIRDRLSGYLDASTAVRQEMLKSTADRLKALAPLLREDVPELGPIGRNPAALRPAKRARPAPSRESSSRRPDESVSRLPGVGPAIMDKLANLGIQTIEDVLFHVPRDHIDFSRPEPIGTAGQGWNRTAVTLLGMVTDLNAIQAGRKRVEVRITDGTGWARITWFNPYIAKQIQVGDQIVVHGEVDSFRGSLSLTGPEWEKWDSPELQRARLIPIYPLTAGIGQKQLRRLTRAAIDATQRTLPDAIPASVLARNGLIGLPHAIAQRHYPANREMLADATRRLAFDELFLLQLGLVQRKRANSERVGNALDKGAEQVKRFLDGLPFPLTRAQRAAIRDVSLDLGRTAVMQRLVQGDVGSGKTVVAAAAAVQAVASGFQVAVMAPTEILATQLHGTLNRLYEHLGDDRPTVRLLTGTTGKRERVELHEKLQNGEIDVLVGTQAIIQQGVLFNRLGLSIVDEQHRFGVRQRGELPSKSTVGPAHVLTMSATPIPRSLNMVLMGDIDVSVIDEMPPGREPVRTRRFMGEERVRAYNLVRREVAAGRQAFVICPLVEESDTSDKRSAVAEAKRLQRDVFPDLRITLLHGRMSGA
ncbi:MAG: DEAD/DEAH box helicase, partial [Chloroflexota bacterium]|nr:DEAD/DEAH box helicase [Chloroflexota bacterium]